ncbi:MAG: histidine phosphatase family protein [bacterium]
MSNNIYLVRSGESVVRANDRERQLSSRALDRLNSLSKRITETPPEIVFHSDTKRAEHTAELLWPTVKKCVVSGLYTPIEQNLFTDAKTFLETNNAEAIRSVWAQVHQKTETEKAVTNLYNLCYKTTEQIIEQTVRVTCFAIVGHEVIINLVGHFLANVKINKESLLNARFENGEVRLIKTEEVLILS